jgi:hypothetical protein
VCVAAAAPTAALACTRSQFSDITGLPLGPADPPIRHLFLECARLAITHSRLTITPLARAADSPPCCLRIGIGSLRPCMPPPPCNITEASWLVNGGHGASLRHHEELPLLVMCERGEQPHGRAPLPLSLTQHTAPQVWHGSR